VFLSDFRNSRPNTSNALMSGGIHALAGAAELMILLLKQRTGREPQVFLAGCGAEAGPHLPGKFSMVDNSCSKAFR